MTPLTKLGNIYFKREDQNPTGSVKDRAVALQVEYLKKNNYSSAVISSSGNAAISALYFCRQNQINLTISVSPKINPAKLKLLSSANIIKTTQPISSAFKFAKTNHANFLRQSTDPVALIGYQTIAKELIDQLPQITSIFLPVGSGTTLLGISQALPSNVKIYAVQPASHCPISGVFDTDYSPETETITDSLSVKLLPLKSQVLTAIRKSSGQGIVVQNQSVIETRKFLGQNQISTSAESALALAGYFKIQKQLNTNFYPVILFTGAQR